MLLLPVLQAAVHVVAWKWSLFVWSLVFSISAVSDVHTWRAISGTVYSYTRICSPFIPMLLFQILQMIAGGTRGLGYVYSGRVVAGIGVGAIFAVAPTFKSECAPKEVRACSTGLNQVMIGVGPVLSYFINCVDPFSMPSCTHL